MIVRQKRYPKGAKNEVETRLAWLVDFRKICYRFWNDFGIQNQAKINDKRSWEAMQQKTALENEKMSMAPWK